MTHRPRYSLLTLLVLTAFVAGGVKLWRGPHRGITNLPLTKDQANYYSRYLGYDIEREVGRGALETESIRDGWETRLLWIKSLPPEAADPLYLHIIVTYSPTAGFGEDGRVSTNPPVALDKNSSPYAAQTPVHRIIATYHARVESDPMTDDLFVDGLFNTVYQVTETQTIYEGSRAGLTFFGQISFHPIKLEDIPEPSLRARIKEDLAKLKN